MKFYASVEKELKLKVIIVCTMPLSAGRAVEPPTKPPPGKFELKIWLLLKAKMALQKVKKGKLKNLNFKGQGVHEKLI